MTTTIFWPWSILLLSHKGEMSHLPSGQEPGKGAPVRLGIGQLIDGGESEPSSMFVRQGGARAGENLEGNAMMGERKLQLEKWRPLSGSLQPRQDPHPAPARL